MGGPRPHRFRRRRTDGRRRGPADHLTPRPLLVDGRRGIGRGRAAPGGPRAGRAGRVRRQDHDQRRGDDAGHRHARVPVQPRRAARRGGRGPPAGPPRRRPRPPAGRRRAQRRRGRRRHRALQLPHGRRLAPAAGADRAPGDDRHLRLPDAGPDPRRRTAAPGAGGAGGGRNDVRGPPPARGRTAAGGHRPARRHGCRDRSQQAARAGALRGRRPRDELRHAPRRRAGRRHRPGGPRLRSGATARDAWRPGSRRTCSRSTAIRSPT